MSGKLTPEEFDKWIKELNDPENHQVRYRLVDFEDKPNAFCCLGVLSYKVLGQSTITYPNEVGKMESDALHMCTKWNDIDTLTFPEIAQKLIENRQDYVEESNEKNQA